MIAGPAPTACAPAAPSPLARAGVGAVLVALTAALYLPTLAGVPFFTRGEAREALVVKLVLEGAPADWILPKRPYRKGARVASKPPLYHWLAAATALASGGRVTEWNARLPSALLAVGAVVATGLVGAELLGVTGGLVAGVVLTTNPGWLRAATTTRVDMTLAAILTLLLLAFWRAWVRGEIGQRTALGVAVGTGLAVLAKGPVGFVLPVGVIATSLALTRDAATARALRPVRAFAVACGIAVPWYVLAVLVGGREFLYVQVLRENVGRYLPIEGELALGVRHGPFYYVPSLLLDFLPWSVLLVVLAVAGLRKGYAWRDRCVLFPAVWFGVTFLFFSAAAAKRAAYLLPCFPALALLVGAGVSAAARHPRAPGPIERRVARGVALALAAGAALTALGVGAGGEGFDPARVLGPFLGMRDRANLPLLWQAIQQARWAVVLVALGAACGLVALPRAYAAGRVRLALGLVAAVTTGFLLVLQHVFRPALAERRDFRDYAIELRTLADASPDERLCAWPLTFDYGLWFYVDRPIPFCADALSAPRDQRGAERAQVLMWSDEWRKLASALGPEVTERAVSRSSVYDRDRRILLVAGPSDAFARLLPAYQPVPPAEDDERS